MGGLDARDVHAKNGTLAAMPTTPVPHAAGGAGSDGARGGFLPSTAASSVYPVGESRSAPAPFQLPTPDGDAGDEVASLVAQLPSPDDIRALVSAFATFDLGFRLVPTAWFRARTEDLVARLPAVTGGDDTPLLALLAGVLLVGASARAGIGAGIGGAPAAAPGAHPNFGNSGDKTAIPHLRHIYDRLMWHCTTYGPYNCDFAHAALVGCADAMTGPESSMTRAWVASGTARAALLLARTHVDRDDESLPQREIKRRIWWQHYISNQLNLPPEVNTVEVPRPLLIPDAALVDDGGRGSATSATPDVLPDATAGVCEWAYVDSKIGWAQVCDASQRILGSTTEPLAARLESCHALATGYFDALPEYLRVPPPAPQWAHAQSLITRIGVHDRLVRLYRPYFALDADSAEAVELALAGVDALGRGVDAALALVADIESLTQFLLFRWLDSASTQLWTFGTRAFMAGMALAYAVLAGRGGDRERSALDGALGALRMSAGRGASHVNAKALDTLERVRALVVARSDAAGVAHPSALGNSVTDPYSGTDIAMPCDAAPTLDVSAWDEWDALFTEFLRGDLVVPP